MSIGLELFFEVVPFFPIVQIDDKGDLTWGASSIFCFQVSTSNLHDGSAVQISGHMLFYKGAALQIQPCFQVYCPGIDCYPFVLFLPF